MIFQQFSTEKMPQGAPGAGRFFNHLLSNAQVFQTP
jgi:hypothetical protein